MLLLHGMKKFRFFLKISKIFKSTTLFNKLNEQYLNYKSNILIFKDKGIFITIWEIVKRSLPISKQSTITSYHNHTCSYNFNFVCAILRNGESVHMFMLCSSTCSTYHIHMVHTSYPLHQHVYRATCSCYLRNLSSNCFKKKYVGGLCAFAFIFVDFFSLGCFKMPSFFFLPKFKKERRKHAFSLFFYF